MSKIPADIEFFVNDKGVYIELESFIRFLKANDNIPEEYKKEAKHLVNIANYLSEQMADLISQKSMLDEILNKDLPN